jgi:FecR-like protein
MKLSRDGLDRQVAPQSRTLKIEIEPLTDSRWTRVERAVLDAGVAGSIEEHRATPDATPRWRLSAGLLVLAGALAAIGGGLAWRALQPEARAGATRVETATNGSRVEFGESTIDVGPTSAVRLAGDDSHGVVVTLDNGRVECDVTPRRGRPPFLVEAGSVEVRVVGTHFVVARAADAITVDVQRGQVEVTSNGQRSLVSAGSHWPSLAESAPQLPPAAPAASAPAPPTNVVHAGPAETRSGATPATRAASLSPRDQYEAASRLEAQQPAAAIALYRELARQGGAWGENALFAEGRLEADRGDQNDARRLLGEYLARYPTGPNANDARQLLERLR